MRRSVSPDKIKIGVPEDIQQACIVDQPACPSEAYYAGLGTEQIKAEFLGVKRDYDIKVHRKVQTDRVKTSAIGEKEY